MSCQLTWNYNNYKSNVNEGEEIDVAILTSDVALTGVDNNALNDLFGQLVLDITKTKMEDIDVYQENYNIIYSSQDSKVIGSLYVVTGYQQPATDGFQTTLKNVSGTISAQGIFSMFNDGTAIIQYNNETGRRCLSLYVRK